MCVYSMIIDHFNDKWYERWNKNIEPVIVPTPVTPFIPEPQPQITQEELKEFKQLLERARKYDQENNQPDCELEEKKTLIKDLAKKLGVEINFL